MRKLLAKDLKIKFIEALIVLDEFSYDEGNPFLIKIGKSRYFIFLKNLSPAYFKNSPDINRVQLPYSEHFLSILKSDIPFIIIGYAMDTDTMVTWDPAKVKERLNARRNVSLYSRFSFQEGLIDEEFRFGYLSNGEKFIVFKRKNLINFFDSAFKLFAQDDVFDKVKSNDHSKIQEITDKALLQKIKPLLRQNKFLQVVEETSKYYASKNLKMTFKDWHKLVADLYRNIKD